MPERYTDVNIKLHQYQGWESRGLRVLGGFKETVLVVKGKQTFSFAKKAAHQKLKIGTSFHTPLPLPPNLHKK